MSIDLDEIAPNRFIVRNDKVRPFLRDEGSIDGANFELRTWRREGWLARLRMAEFNVRTLDGRVAALGQIDPTQTLGAEVFRPLATSKEQWARFDGARLRWRDVPVVEQRSQRGVYLSFNEPVRRRKSRGSGDFFVIVPQREIGAGLLAVTEDEAVLHAYGLLASANHSPTLPFTFGNDHYQLRGEGILLPPRHAATLDLLSAEKLRWTFGAATAQLAEQVFQKLGIDLVEGK